MKLRYICRKLYYFPLLGLMRVCAECIISSYLQTVRRVDLYPREYEHVMPNISELTKWNAYTCVTCLCKCT